MLKRPIRALFQARVDLFSVPGGDTVQLEKTAEYLRRQGVQVDISLDLTPPLEDYDLVHLFNLTRAQETYVQARNARAQGTPLALSTIYWSLDEYQARGHNATVRSLQRLGGKAAVNFGRSLWRLTVNRHHNAATWQALWRGHRRLQVDVLRWAGILLPNAESEMECLRRDFGVPDRAYEVVPNACDARFLAHPAPPWEQRSQAVCVGRIEPRKNHLALVQALHGTGIPLSIVGVPGRNHEAYYRAVVAAADRNVRFMGAVSNEGLPEIYAQAKFHILPSWFETPGLASLEAAAVGCNVVVSDRGSTRDYFAGFGFYCDPTDVASIRRAALAAWRQPPAPELRQRIAQNYTWERTAEATLRAYARLVNEKRAKAVTA